MSKAEILQELPKLPLEERQEIFELLCDLQEAEAGGVHQQWVDKALGSGPARPATEADWHGALLRGLAQSAKQA